MKNKKVFAVSFIVLILAGVAAYFMFSGKLSEILSEAGLSLPGISKNSSLEGDDAVTEKRSTQTAESFESQLKMEQTAVPENLNVTEDEYGLLTFTAQVKIPDYSVCFAGYLEEAALVSGDEAEFEKELFRLAAQTDGKTVELVTHEISVNLSIADASKGREEWTKEELLEIARREAFEQEMQEFAMELLGTYFGNTTDWEALEERPLKEESHEK